MKAISQGYKKTKIGVIPEEWEVSQIKDVTNYVDYRGKTPKKVSDGILLVTARNIKYGYLDYETSREYIAENDYQNVMSRGTPNIGDVLLTTEAPLGNIAQIDIENIALAQRVIKFRGKDNLDNSYLKYHFLSERFQAYLLKLAIGTTVLGIQGKQLHKMLIPLPLLKEQQKIAKILTTWDSAISIQENLIKEKEQLKKALMQKLLSGESCKKDDNCLSSLGSKPKAMRDSTAGGLRFPEFSGEWKEVKLGDIFDNIGGTALEKYTNKHSQYKFISIGNYSIDGKYVDNNQRIELNEKTKTKLLSKDNLVMVLNDKTASGDLIGSTILIDDDFYIYNQRSERLICKNCIIPLYAWFVLNSKQFRQRIFSISQGGTQIYINYPSVKTLLLNLPSLQEQQKIAQVLSSADKEIDLLKNELESLKEQKKGFMQRLLSGEVRV
jgi:type I restriction enzyme S subunit